VKGLIVLAGAGVVALALLATWGASERLSDRSAQVEIRTAPETSLARNAISKGDPALQWYEPSQAPGTWPDPALGIPDVKQAIQAAANDLAKVDYPSLSLARFVTDTAQLKVQPGDFSPGDVWLDSRAVGQNTHLALYAWRGPEFPQKVGGLLVHRWVQVYALYDVDNRRVVRLLATISGEAIE